MNLTRCSALSKLLKRPLLGAAITAAAASIALLPGRAQGEPGRVVPAAVTVATTPRPDSPWSAWSALRARAASGAIARDVRAGKPLVTVVIVPLCSNDQIDCGSVAAGRPGDLATNLYWGAVFGQRRFFDRKRSGWTRVERTTRAGEATSSSPLLERVIYKRSIPLAPWGGAEDKTGEQIVVFEAVHGGAIDHAVARFFKLATEGGRVQFKDGERDRDEAIHVAGYAGHNRLMDEGAPPLPAPRTGRGAAPIPSFVMACISDSYFSDALRRAGSEPIVMTRSLMAPEGYVVDAITRALGENATRAGVRDRAVSAYAKWQRLSPGVASSVFARLP